jgi:hypothetical protein
MEDGASAKKTTGKTVSARSRFGLFNKNRYEITETSSI